MQYWSPTSTMDGLFFQVWNLLVWLDMARQVVTRNDSTGAFENILLNMRISVTNKDIYYEFKPISI